ncbi:MAG: hypothetical protein LBS50_09600 [Prevotellaceae bacterium]|jgi:hypothetical protein|nr:hypothetical protein [Prevotellaceae bacterium]
MNKTKKAAALTAALAFENPKKQSIVAKIINDLRESTSAVHEINKENLAAEKAAFQENNADFVEFLQAKGLKNKAKVVAKNIKNGCETAAEQEKTYRAKAQSHEAYKKLLQEQRERRTANFSRFNNK